MAVANFRRLCWFSTFVILAGAGLVAADAPPTLDIPETALETNIGVRAYASQVDDSIAYYVRMMAQAKDQETVLKARRGLLSLYRRYSTSAYQYMYAQRLVVKAARLLDHKKPLVRINSGLVFSAVTEVPIRPLLYRMLKDKNDGMRYLAMEGMRRLWSKVLVLGPRETAEFMDTLDKHIVAETSWPVLKAGLEVLKFRVPGGLPAAVPAARMTQAYQASYATLRKVWDRLWKDLWRLRGRNRELATEAARSAVEALESAAGELRKDKPTQAQLVQMVHDVMNASSSAYKQLEAKGEAANLNRMLLQAAESAQNTNLGLTEADRQNFLARALNATNVADTARAQNVRLAVIDGWEPFLRKAKFTVVRKPLPPRDPEPSTQPAKSS